MAVVEVNADAVRRVAKTFDAANTIWMIRSLQDRTRWARRLRIGEQRGGIVGFGNRGRLTAEGMFVGLKPSIADWMLKPDGDTHSSNMLETIPNQHHIQGLEIDSAFAC